uniref:DMAP1-binding domain-containing protein n=1 Tax=Plectus sambesii TaxID=2011161 RepID=A0A914VPJ8_9BILA
MIAQPYICPAQLLHPPYYYYSGTIAGDITAKGYEKKRQHLLAPYIQAQLNGSKKSAASPSTKAHRRHQRRLTRDETRYHSAALSLRAALPAPPATGHCGYLRSATTFPSRRPVVTTWTFAEKSD